MGVPIIRTYFGIYIGISLFWETTSFQELPGLGSLVLPKDLLTSKAYIKIGGYVVEVRCKESWGYYRSVRGIVQELPGESGAGSRLL